MNFSTCCLHQLCHILTASKIHSVLSKERSYNLKQETGRKETCIMQNTQCNPTASIFHFDITMVKNPNVPSLIQILGFSLQPSVALVPCFSVTPSSCNEQFFCHSINKLLIPPTEMCGLPNKAQIQATSSSENTNTFLMPLSTHHNKAQLLPKFKCTSDFS